VSDARRVVFRRLGAIAKCRGRSYWLRSAAGGGLVAGRNCLDQARMVGRMVLLCIHVAVLKIDASHERSS